MSIKETNGTDYKPLTKQQQKLLDVGMEIYGNPLDGVVAFMARSLVQVTLPHSDPGNVNAWGRTNGNLSLTVQPTFTIDHETGETISSGIPYGTIPRLLLFWITTEAIRTNSRRIELGESLSAFMQELGLTPTGGRWGSITRLKEQINRLVKAKISFQSTNEQQNSWLNMDIAPEGELWWDYKSPENPTLFNSWIELGERFFEAIILAPVPVDMRALQVLKRSPLALDLYTWITLKTYVVTERNKQQRVSWKALMLQMGSNYTDSLNFKKKSQMAFQKIQTVYPGMNIEYCKGGLIVKPGQTAVPKRKKKISTEGCR